MRQRDHLGLCEGVKMRNSETKLGEELRMGKQEEGDGKTTRH